MNLVPDIDLISLVLIFLSLWVLSNFFLHLEAILKWFEKI